MNFQKCPDVERVRALVFGHDPTLTEIHIGFDVLDQNHKSITSSLPPFIKELRSLTLPHHSILNKDFATVFQYKDYYYSVVGCSQFSLCRWRKRDSFPKHLYSARSVKEALIDGMNSLAETDFELFLAISEPDWYK